MKKLISIEYCTSWGYLSRAVALAESLLNQHKNKLQNVSIVPSSGGVFEIKLDEDLVFSKKELGRFPEENEVEKLINNKISMN